MSMRTFQQGLQTPKVQIPWEEAPSWEGKHQLIPNLIFTPNRIRNHVGKHLLWHLQVFQDWNCVRAPLAAPHLTTLITAVIARAYILGNPDMPPQVLTTTWLVGVNDPIRKENASLSENVILSGDMVAGGQENTCQWVKQMKEIKVTDHDEHWVTRRTAESLYCTLETNTTLYVNYTSI